MRTCLFFIPQCVLSTAEIADKLPPFVLDTSHLCLWHCDCFRISSPPIIIAGGPSRKDGLRRRTVINLTVNATSQIFATGTSFHPKDQDLDQYHFVAPKIQTYTVIDSWWHGDPIVNFALLVIHLT